MSRRKKTSRRPKSRSRARRPPRREAPDLVSGIRPAIASGEPLDLLELASGFMSALDVRDADPFKQQRPELTLSDFAETLVQTPMRETSALLAAVAAMTEDELLAARINRELVARQIPLPDWLVGLRSIAPYRVVSVVDDLGDGEEIILSARLPTGEPISVNVFVDHNLGTVVKDAFAVPRSLEDVLEVMSQHPEFDEDTTTNELEPAEARARLSAAIDNGARTYPPYQTEHWPACRPLVEWLCAGLPAGGAGYAYREWKDTDRAEIADRFFASPFGSGMEEPDARSLLDDLLWYGTGYSNGDPFRWSTPKVEVLLLDWLPRKIVADARYLAQVPPLLRAYVEFAHAEAGIREALTVEILDAVDDFTAEYLEIIGKPRLQGPAALLARMGVYEPNEVMRADLERTVGGAEALANLDDVPLPDEEFDWAGMPAYAVATTEQVLAHLDEVVGARLGVEYRTACRRLLRRIAVDGPEVLGRRAAKPSTSAAAIAWLIGQANDLFSRYGSSDRIQVKDLLAEFGVTSVSQRARAFMTAIGVDDQQYHVIELGDPGLLVSVQRRRICEQRDLH